MALPSESLTNEITELGMSLMKNLSGHFRKKLNRPSCFESGVVYGKVVSDLLNSLNSRRCKKQLLSVFFSFYILNLAPFYSFWPLLSALLVSAEKKSIAVTFIFLWNRNRSKIFQNKFEKKKELCIFLTKSNILIRSEAIKWTWKDADMTSGRKKGYVINIQDSRTHVMTIETIEKTSL